MHPFNEELRKVRLELGLSLRQVQEDIGFSRCHLSEIESGKYNITPKSGVLLCDYYGIDVSLFLDYKNYMLLKEIKKATEELDISLQYNR
jgi:transcriptional regulator with XRE-family HTH domain